MNRRERHERRRDFPRSSSFPKSSPFHAKPAISYIYFIVKQLAPFQEHVRVEELWPSCGYPSTFQDPEESQSALMLYMRYHHPYHRSIEPPAGVDSGGVSRIMEGYIKEYVYRNGDWIDETVTGWAWVGRELAE